MKTRKWAKKICRKYWEFWSIKTTFWTFVHKMNKSRSIIWPWSWLIVKLLPKRKDNSTKNSSMLRFLFIWRLRIRNAWLILEKNSSRSEHGSRLYLTDQFNPHNKATKAGRVLRETWETHREAARLVVVAKLRGSHQHVVTWRIQREQIQ